MAADADSLITRATASIREIAGEPATNAKYTDARLITWIEKAYAHVVGEINRRANNPIIIRYDVTLDEDFKVYQLPPTIGRILDFELLNSDEDFIWNLLPRSYINPSGPNFTIEHQTIRFRDDPPDTYILRIHYTPSGCIRLSTATLTGGNADMTNDLVTDNDCTIILPTQANVTATGAGTLDTRPNAYLGSILRILQATDADYQQDRIITAYDVTTRTVTVEPAYTAALLPDAGAGTIMYEICPPVWEALDMAIAAWVAMTLVGIEGDRTRYSTVTRVYQDMIRDTIAQGKWINSLKEGLRRDSRFAQTTGNFVPSYLTRRG